MDGSTIDIELDKKLRYHEHVLGFTLRVIFEVNLMFKGVSKKTKPTMVS